LPHSLCKRSASPARDGKRPRRGCRAAAHATYLVWAALLSALSGCAGVGLPALGTVSLTDLETSPARLPSGIQRGFIEDPAALESLVYPLGRRLGLLEVRDAQQWHLLAQAVPGLRECPDLSRGALVGLVNLAGTPIGGGPPFRLKAVRIHRGAGLIEVQFNSGTYLPDGSYYFEMVYVTGLRTVLVVNVDGLEYVAGQSIPRTANSRTSLIH
jgi:hypothetical protein